MITIVKLAINTSGFSTTRAGVTTKSIISIRGTNGLNTPDVSGSLGGSAITKLGKAIFIANRAVNLLTSGFNSARVGNSTKSIVSIRGTNGLNTPEISGSLGNYSMTKIREVVFVANRAVNLLTSGFNAPKIGREIKVAVKAALIQFWS
jgi:hypothetical protein